MPARVCYYAVTDAPIPYRSELARKALHLLALVLPAVLYLADRGVALVTLAALAIGALLVEAARSRSAGVHAFILRGFGWMMREAERPPLGRFRMNGATWMLLAACILLAGFPSRIAALALAVCIAGDAAAALIGRRFGRRRWGHGPKTVEGTAAFILAGAFVGSFFPQPQPWIAALAATLAGFLELLPGPLNDNLQTPILTALGLTAAEWAIGA
jgi:dolichol kinase